MALLKASLGRYILNFVTNRGKIVTQCNYSTGKTQGNDEPVEMENPYKKERCLCILCKMKITPDYKNVRLLSQFQSPYTGRIYGRHITGLCKGKQELVQQEITKAQNCAYMPYMFKNREFLKDPKLFDPQNPIRSHRF